MRTLATWDGASIPNLLRRPVDPASPYPEDCESQAEGKRQKAEAKRKEAQEAAKSGKAHKEL